MSWLKPRPTKIREPSDCCGSPGPFAFAECKQVPARHTRILERSLCCGSPGCFPSLKILPHISNFRRNQRTGGLRRCSLTVAARTGKPVRQTAAASRRTLHRPCRMGDWKPSTFAGHSPPRRMSPRRKTNSEWRGIAKHSRRARYIVPLRRQNQSSDG